MNSNEIGLLGEKITVLELKEKGLWAERGTQYDVKAYRTKPSSNTSKLINYFAVEVKTSTKNKVHDPPLWQLEENDLLVKINILKRDQRGVKYMIKYELLSDKPKKFVKDIGVFKSDWEVKQRND